MAKNIKTLVASAALKKLKTHHSKQRRARQHQYQSGMKHRSGKEIINSMAATNMAAS